VTGYKTEHSAKCENEMREITCQGNGLFSGTDADYKYSYCMTWDGTDT
jgi:hypothetical protein